jgi:hypothetical protein
MLRYLTVLIGLVCVPWLMPMDVAAQQNDVAGASDYAGFQRFPGSDITDYRREANTIYNLALGRMQRVDGRVASSRVERLQGELIRITYAIPDGFTAQEAYDYWREQVVIGGQLQLFECQGRGCGSSNFWANDKFENRVLYGPESNQFYIASTFNSERNGQPVAGYVALYAITRANRRVYVHLDFLQLPSDEAGGIAVTPEAISQRLMQEGSVVLPNLSFDAADEMTDDSGVEFIVQILRRDTMLNVYLVGHLQAQSGEDTEALIERSAQRADSVRQAVMAAGIDGSRVQAHGVGPLAPFCRPAPCAERIEMVLR